ncbi:MAG TPA: hypothetical protein DDW41_04120 [Candidatus Andersenbacteria bacterium]|nr:hypothetical protein [Candidatus Andersenbacteria bacterium]
MSYKHQALLVVSILATATALLIASLSFAFSQYIRILEHNLDVVNSMRLCANLSGEAVGDCSDAVKRQKVTLPFKLFGYE